MEALKAEGLYRNEVVETTEDELPVNSVFHDENFQPVVLIQLTRLYDVGLALLSVFEPEKAAAMAAAHEKGEVFSPAPAWKEDE